MGTDECGNVSVHVYYTIHVGITFQPSMSSQWYRPWRKVMMH